jgi:hypothetical protein
MDARTPLQFTLPMSLPNEVPSHVQSDLWDLAHGMYPPGREVGIADFESLARVVATRVKRKRLQNGDAAAWLQDYGESRHLPAEEIRFAIELAFEVVLAEDEPSDEARPPEVSDHALATNFAERHKGDLRYVAEWSRWMQYDGRCWREDKTLNAFWLVRKICCEASVLPNRSGIRIALASMKTIAAVERLARCDRELAATVDQWDSDLMLLNTPGAVIDLRTGASRPPRPSDYMTKTGESLQVNGAVWRISVSR